MPYIANPFATSFPLHVDMCWDVVPPDCSSWLCHFPEQHFRDGHVYLQLTGCGCSSL